MKPWLCRRPNFKVCDTLLSELRPEDGNKFKIHIDIEMNLKVLKVIVK